jgi:hypothetical protein
MAFLQQDNDKAAGNGPEVKEPFLKGEKIPDVCFKLS